MPAASWKPRTVKTYKLALGHIKRRFGKMRLGDIKRTHINEFAADLVEQGITPRTTHLFLNVLHGIFKDAVEEELVHRNPGVRVRRPRARRYEPHPLTSQECRLVEAALTDE
jgi:integrase